ncbi:MAG: glycosyltransferase [Candidatus Pacebacteria bacterium]|nr:glycosyltransferase [Candidatus Paceibacterota bacterium]
MKLLMISNDKNILDPQSAVALRQIEYAKEFEEVHILLRGKAREMHLGQNVWVYCSWWRYGLARFLLKTRNITHVTCQDPFENGLIGVLLKKRHPLHLELQIHTDIGSPYFQNENIKNKIRTYLAKYTLSYADHVRVVSNKIKEYITRYVDQDKIEVRPIAVDVSTIKDALITVDLHKEFPGKKILLCISRLEKEKRVDMAIEAVRQLKNVHLVIVGDGSQRRLLEKKAIGLPVSFFGWRKDTASFYKTADIFINTSLYEGYGMTLAEAHAAGLKILSTDVGVAKDVGSTIIQNIDDIIQNI